MTIVVDIYGTRTIITDDGTPPSDGQALTWDSDSELWKPRDAASAISNLKDVQLDSEGVSLLKNGFTLVYDSDKAKWVPGQGSTVGTLDDLTDVIINTGQIKDSDTVTFKNVDSDTWATGDLTGVWETIVTNVCLKNDPITIPYVYSLTDKFYVFRKQVQASRWWILAPVVDTNKKVVSWRFFDTNATAADRLAFNTKTVIGAPAISGTFTTTSVSDLVFDSENPIGLPLTGTKLGASFDISVSEFAAVPLLKDGNVLTYVQSLDKWIPKDAATDVETLTNVSLYENDSESAEAYGRVPGATLVWDSDVNKWITKKLPLTQLGMLKPVDMLNLQHKDLLYWDSDEASFVINEIPITSVTSSKNFVETFEATRGQREFILNERPWGDVIFSRNGIVINGDAITVDRENRKVSYDSDFNAGSGLDSDDLVQIQYVYASVAANSKLGDLVDVDDALLTPSAGETLLWDSDLESWVGSPIDNSVMACETFIATNNQVNFVLADAAAGDVIVSRNGATIPTSAFTTSVDGLTAIYNRFNNDSEFMVAGDLVTITYLKGSAPRAFAPIAIANAPDVVSTGRTNGSILYYDGTALKHRYTTDSDRLNGAILTWNSGHNAYKHITTTSMNAGNGQGTMMWWDQTGQNWQGTPTPIYNTTGNISLYRRKQVPVVFDYATQKTKYFNDEYVGIYLNATTLVNNITVDSWLNPANSSTYVTPGALGTGSYLSNTSQNPTVLVFQPGLDIMSATESPVYEVEVKIQVTPSGGATWTYLNWKLATFTGSPVDLGVSGQSWSSGATVPSGVSANSHTQKFMYTADPANVAANRFSIRAVSAASSTSGTTASFDLRGSHITWRRVG